MLAVKIYVTSHSNVIGDSVFSYSDDVFTWLPLYMQNLNNNYYNFCTLFFIGPYTSTELEVVSF